MLRVPQLAAATTGLLSLSVLLAGHVAAQDDSAVSSSQYWHERYHGILSMSAYSPDYLTECPAQTFTQAQLIKSFPDSTDAPWTLLQQFGPTVSGLKGFMSVIPEMDKVVLVFQGLEGWGQLFNHTLIPINDIFNLGCPDCMAHAGAVQAYLEAKEATSSFIAASQTVAITGHQYSVTGHAFGGMVAQVAALDLGWQGQIKWLHSHGSERVFNQASADMISKLFGGEASQRTVANNDNISRVIPAGTPGYVFAGQGFHITGDGVSNSTYGMSYVVCETADDPECLGGDDETDSLFYYTSIGSCGGVYKYNETALEASASSMSSSFYATATFLPPNTTTTAAAATSTSADANATSTASTPTGVAALGAAATTGAGGSSGASQVSVSIAYALGTILALFAGAQLL